MTVAELIAALQQFPGDLEVVTPGFDEANFEPVGTVGKFPLARASWQEAGHYSEWWLDPDDVAETRTVVVIDFAASAKYDRMSAERQPS